MRKSIPSIYWGAAFATLLTAWPVSADLIHRYSFSGNANDSVGTAHGTAVQRSNANGPLGAPVTFQSGQAVLDGAGAYIDLPNGMFSRLTNVTIEAWVTWDGGGAWQRIFDFGTSTSGEDPNGSAAIGNGLNYVFLTPNGAGSGRTRFAITDASNGGERPILNDADQFPIGEQVHVAVAYGPPVDRVFVNGRQVAAGEAVIPLSALQDLNNWLGRSNWNDPMFAGSFNEFRVHNNLLGVPELKASSTAGPDALNYDPGAISSISLTVQNTMVSGQSQALQIKATFAGIGEVDLGAADVTLSSSSASVLRVTPAGVLSAVGIGNATITAARGGRSATANITVSPSAAAVLKNRYGFNEPVGSTTITDSVGTQNGLVVDSVAPAAALSLTNGQMNFPGGAYQTAGYVVLVPGLISSKTNITIELWATWNGAANSNWQRIFDFGESQKGDNAQIAGNGLGYLFLTPRAGAAPNPVRFAARPDGATAENPILNAATALTVGQESHIVVIYAPDYKASRLYVNGILVASGDAPFALRTLNDANNWLGASQYNDPPFNGRINELRIYEGVLTDMEVVLSRSAGPNALAAAPGALQSVSLTTSPLFPGNPTAFQSSFRANFQNVTNVDIIAVSGVTITSTDTNVFTVNATGGLLSRNVGTASLIATFQGLSSTSSVSVTAPTALRHDIATNTLSAGGVLVAATLRADFPSTTNVNVNGYAGVTRSSSNTNVVTIAANGNVTAVAPGTATISSTYSGLTAQTQLTVVLPANYTRGQLTHRYSFSGSRDTTAVSDSVGTAHGEVVGIQSGATNNNFNGAGQLALAGSAWNAAPLAAYVNLPNGLLSNLTSVTFEGWATWRGGADNQRFFDFGMSSGAPIGTTGFGEDVVLNPGMSYMFLSPQAGTPRFAIKQGTAAETPSVTSSLAITQNTNSHFAVVYDPPHGVVRLYINGRRAGTAAATLPLSVVDDRNAWLGRSNWQDPLFNVLFDEFRIYNGPLLDADITTSFAAGPNSLPDPGTIAPGLAARIAGTNLEITWPASATGYVLETTSALGTTWTPVAGTPTSGGADLKVTIPLTSGRAFYRLRK
jgi:hypothetical protein